MDNLWISYDGIMTHSRDKGARGELEACEALEAIGLDCRRTVQYNGKGGTADIVCDAAADLHIEVKRTERLNPYMFLDQAIRDATPHKRTPLVVCRSSYKPWLIVCRVSDLPKVAEQIIEGRRRGGVQAHSPGEAVQPEAC